MPNLSQAVALPCPHNIGSAGRARACGQHQLVVRRSYGLAGRSRLISAADAYLRREPDSVVPHGRQSATARRLRTTLVSWQQLTLPRARTSRTMQWRGPNCKCADSSVWAGSGSVGKIRTNVCFPDTQCQPVIGRSWLILGPFLAGGSYESNVTNSASGREHSGLCGKAQYQ